MSPGSFEVIAPTTGPHEPKRVEGWSLLRLPYGNKYAWAVKFRNELRKELARVSCGSGEVLHAVYESNDEKFCDAENILFYNVKEAALKHLAHSGLRFERKFSDPASQRGCVEKHIKYHHHQRYSMAPRIGTFGSWTRIRVIAKWNNIDCGTSVRTPDNIWHAMKQGVVETAEVPFSPVSRFGVTALLRYSGEAKNAARLVKPIFDGVISAFHAHNGEQREEISVRLSHRLGVSSWERIAELLEDDEIGLLGTRRLSSPFREGLKWNPADDNCVAGEMLLEPQTSGHSWSLSGEIYQVESC